MAIKKILRANYDRPTPFSDYFYFHSVIIFKIKNVCKTNLATGNIKLIIYRNTPHHSLISDYSSIYYLNLVI